MPPWVPNAISFIRIGLVPVWLVLAIRARADAMAGLAIDRTVLLVVLVSLGLSDVIDGTIARHFKLTSNLGATLDAVADKLAQVVSVTFLVFFSSPGFTPLPLWLWLTLVLRDGALAVGWVLVYRKHRVVVVEHKWHGKASSLVLFAVIVMATAALPELAVLVGSALSVLLIIPGSVAYVREGLRQLAQGPTVT
ncbi:MAG: CDP-alcohol phosphatidyltransferase family protein [Myxococcales bacterium]|nr:CDP-alcohol phosphatidyltransferase family protein [Myxococcales bacterium]